MNSAASIESGPSRIPAYVPLEISDKRVRVTAADFNGETWDGSPFSHTPEWLLDALKALEIAVSSKSYGYDYAVWQIGDDPKCIAMPGDVIVFGDDRKLTLDRHPSNAC